MFGVILLTENLRAQNVGRELVFSADLWYNRTNEKPLPLGEVAMNLALQGLRRRGRTIPLSPAIAGDLPKGEPWDTCNLRGMGFARSICNTNAKLAR